MTQTTEGLEVPDALELIAKWLREGREVEELRVHTPEKGWSTPTTHSAASGTLNVRGYIYRAAPRKPRVGVVEPDSPPFPEKCFFKAIELTTEVRAALKAAGIEWEDV